MTAEERRKVVVTFTPDMYEYEERSLFAARIAGLGLTSYGRTGDEAVAGLDSLFRAFVEGHRETGRLEEVLDRSGVVWEWLDSIRASTGMSLCPKRSLLPMLVASS